MAVLSPNDRQVYLDELRPPTGYILDRAITTTYSLDLLSLLMAPLSMVMQTQQNTRSAMEDPTALLESLRRTADRLVVFCQQGQIAVPKTSTLLYSYLEPLVYEVQPQGRGVFHPKLWLLRFTPEDPAMDKPVVYRFLCLSRNLTFDRSWDTILALEGEVQERKNGYGRNKPLADFIKELPALAVGPLSAKAVSHVDLMVDEVRRVLFTAPPGFYEDFCFLPMGIRRYQQPPTLSGFTRLMVVSPFLSDEILEPLAQGAEHRNILISRTHSLDRLSDDTFARIEPKSQVFSLAEDAERTEEEDAVDDLSRPSPEADFSGLHAKLFIGEKGWDATIFTGSANATWAAMAGENVEFMVELHGKKSAVGIDPFLGQPNDKNAFQSLLASYQRPTESVVDDTVAEMLDRRLQDAKRAIVKAGLRLAVQPQTGGMYELVLTAGEPIGLGEDDIQVVCYPISVRSGEARDLEPLFRGEAVVFPEMPLVSLTGFVAFEMRAVSEGSEAKTAFVLNIPVDGMPAEREKRILEAIISDRGRFLRYLLLLLADAENAGHLASLLIQTQEGQAGEGVSSLDIPLMEELVRTASRHPEKLVRVAELVRDLSETESGRQLLPEGFEQLWQAFLPLIQEVATSD